MRGAARAIVTAATVLGGLWACKFDEVTVPVGKERPVVHAVLRPRNPDAGTFVVLVERTLTGRVDVTQRGRIDPADPIVTGGGIPITGAIVTLEGLGDTTVAIEDVTEPSRQGKGAGVYRFFNRTKRCDERFGCPPPNSFPVVAGGSYRLRINTTSGQEITGATTVPAGITLPDTFFVRIFDRERDTLLLAWAPAPLAGRYSLQISSPREVFELFTDESEIRVPGDIRNVFVKDMPRVFIPGFRQIVNIAAVDSNYFDYFRSRNDPFTGAGIINHLQGATGVFGSYVLLQKRTLEVVAPIDEPLEGDYVSRGPTLVDDVLRLYVESRSNAGTGLSGYTVAADTASGASRSALLGTAIGSRVTLGVLRAQRITDTAYVFTLEARGDSLIGTVAGERGNGPVVFVRP